MTLTELRQAVEWAVEAANECGEDPDQIVVTLQLDRDSGDSLCSSEEVELHYDNNLQVSGCVIVADLAGKAFDSWLANRE